MARARKTAASTEDTLLHHLAPYLTHGHTQRFALTVGDDAAVRRPGSESLVFTTDAQVENVHFDLRYMDLREVGYRAMAVNLSDCAAMGAVPDSALVELVIPANHPHVVPATRALYQGFATACRRWAFPIVGGNITSGPCWMVSITLVGRMEPGSTPLQRTTAQAGERVWVSGRTGQAAAGLAALRRWGRAKIPRRHAHLVSHHLRPRPRVALGQALRRCGVRCAMDISDGLSVDCARMARASGVGIVLHEQALAPTPGLRRLAVELGVDPEQWVLHGGEDFELLFTTPPDIDRATLVSAGAPALRCIGETRAAPPCVHIRRGETEGALGTLGWDHLTPTLPSSNQRW